MNFVYAFYEGHSNINSTYLLVLKFKTELRRRKFLKTMVVVVHNMHKGRKEMHSDGMEGKGGGSFLDICSKCGLVLGQKPHEFTHLSSTMLK
jgi:hypothetical protein